jgi:hypothetical protein
MTEVREQRSERRLDLLLSHLSSESLTPETITQEKRERLAAAPFWFLRFLDDQINLR